MTASLQGKRILNTRPAAQASALHAAITQAGGQSIDFPTLTVQATPTDWLCQLPDLARVQHAIFVSANAVRYCLTALQQQHLPWPATLPVIAIGQATAAALRSFGVAVQACPVLSTSEGLLALPSLKNLCRQTVVLVTGKDGRTLIGHTLAQRQAHVITVEVYQRGMPAYDPQAIAAVWRNDLVDIILITSSQSLHNLFALFGKQAQQWLQSKTYVVLSERLAHEASALGIQDLIISHHDKLMETLVRIKLR